MKKLAMAILMLGIASCAVENEPVSSPAPEAQVDEDAQALGNPCGFFVCTTLAYCKSIEGAISRPAPGCNGANTCCDL